MLDEAKTDFSLLQQPPPEVTAPTAPTAISSAASSSTPPVSRLRSQPQQSHLPIQSARSRDAISISPGAHSHFPETIPQSRRWSRDSDSTLVPTPRRDASPQHTLARHAWQPQMTSSSEQHLYDDSEAYNNLSRHQGPLIDLVTNDWQKTQKYRDSSESQDSYTYFMSEKDGFKSPMPTWLSKMHFPRRVQRYLIAYVLLLLACWLGWLYYLRPAWAEEKALDDSLEMATKSGSSFGVNIRPLFTDMIHLKELDPKLIPGAEGTKDRRLVFIGDVHGCAEELQRLLDKINFVKNKDHAVFTGDLISKGPDSVKAVDIAMKYDASCVRGNHEDRTLLAHKSLHSKVEALQGPQEDPMTQEDFLDEESFSHGDYKDRALAKLLPDYQIRWLKKCPVVLKVGPVQGFNGGGDIVVVHAGLVPGVPLDRQDPFLAMNMRTIDLKTRVPSEDRGGEPWEKLWNHYQAHTHPPSERTTVIYGHDSKRGLTIRKYSKGIDSSCLRGGTLTALIIDDRGHQKLVSVDCKKYRS